MVRELEVYVKKKVNKQKFDSEDNWSKVENVDVVRKTVAQQVQQVAGVDVRFIYSSKDWKISQFFIITFLYVKVVALQR